MLNVLRGALVGVLAILLSYGSALAYEGEIGSGHVWGNPTSAQAPPTDADPQAIFNQRYCTTANILFGTTAASTWGCITVGTGLTLSGGTLSLTSPVTVAHGGTNAVTASGTSLDNITGFSSTGYLARTGAGAYAFNPTNTLPLNTFVNSSPNTMLGNWTGSSGAVAANAIPSCSDSGGNHLNYVSGTGITCGSTNSGGAMVLLNTLTASTSATLGDTTSLTATYSSYLIVFENLIPATTSSQQAELQVHSGGSFQATSYLGTNFSASTVQNVLNSTTFVPLSQAAAGISTLGVSGWCRVYAPSGTTVPKAWTCQTMYYNTANAIINEISGFWNSAGAVDGFQFLFGTGNIASGVIKIYGVL